MVQLQKEFQLEIEESDTKHAPNEFVKNNDKNVVQLTFIIFFDKPIGSMFGMENSSGKWILVDTFFQNEGILVDIFKGWILVEIFHEFSWTFIVHENSSFLVNFHGHFGGEF